MTWGIAVNDYPNGHSLLAAVRHRAKAGGLRVSKRAVGKFLAAYVAFGGKARFTEKQWAYIHLLATSDDLLAKTHPASKPVRVPPKARRITKAERNAMSPPPLQCMERP